MRLKRTLLFFFFLLVGVILGALLASLCSGVPGLSWLAFSRGVGLSPSAPFVLDLSVFKLSFGFYIDVSVAQLVFIAIAIVLYTKLVKKVIR